MDEKKISEILNEQEKTEVIKIIIEALQKAIINEKPHTGGVLCEKCIHREVCYVTITTDEKDLKLLSHCDFYEEEL